MGTVERVTDRSLGYLGLLLIGAISWAADHVGPACRPEPGVPIRVVSGPSATPARAARPGVPPAMTQRAGG